MYYFYKLLADYLNRYSTSTKKWLRIISNIIIYYNTLQYICFKSVIIFLYVVFSLVIVSRKIKYLNLNHSGRLANIWWAERFPWYVASTSTLNFYFFFPTSVYMLWRICSCTAWRLLMNYCEKNIFTKIGSVAKCWLDIHHWSAILAVTARLRGTGQNVFKFSLETGCSSNLTYVHILLLNAFLAVALITNVT